MKGGVDKGFCLSYWQLSYRRKLIRTIWTGVIMLPIVVLLQILGLVTQMLQGMGVPFPNLVFWAYLVFLLITGGAQVWYNYHYWRVEDRSTSQHDLQSSHALRNQKIDGDKGDLDDERSEVSRRLG